MDPAWHQRTTYDKTSPWVMYRYLIPDALAWLIGFSLVRTQCLICGTIERHWLRVWRADSRVGQRIRLRTIERHQHGNLRYNPSLWVLPRGNPAGWREWVAKEAWPKQHQPTRSGGHHGKLETRR